MNELIQNPSQPLKIENRFSEFFSQLEIKTLSPQTLANYKKSLNNFIQWLETKNEPHPTEKTIWEYRNYLLENYSDGTAAMYLLDVKQLFKWLSKQDINSPFYYPNVADDVPAPTVDKLHKKDSLTLEQCETLLGSLDTETEQGLRDFIIIALMLTTALRIGSFRTMDNGDIKTRNGKRVIEVSVKGSKYHGKEKEKDKFVELTPSMARLIEKYQALKKAKGIEIEENSPLFVSTSNNSRGKRIALTTLSNNIKKRFKAVGLDSKRLTSHSLRRTAINQNLKEGGTLQETKQLAMHRSLLTTQIYLDELNQLENPSVQRLSKLFDLE